MANIGGDPIDDGARSMDRRGLIKTGAAVGAAAWVIPQLISTTAAAAGTQQPTNLALATAGGVASQSSTYDASTTADLANNGIISPNTYPTNVAITTASDEPQAESLFAPGVPVGSQWWNVDLGALHALSSITVYNRDAATGIPERSQNLEVHVDGVSQGIIPGTTGAWQVATMPLAVSGQNVTVVNGTGAGTPNPTYLQLAEVQVFGS